MEEADNGHAMTFSADAIIRLMYAMRKTYGDGDERHHGCTTRRVKDGNGNDL